MEMPVIETTANMNGTGLNMLEIDQKRFLVLHKQI